VVVDERNPVSTITCMAGACADTSDLMQANPVPLTSGGADARMGEWGRGDDTA
jgi:hypothetical protein